MKYEPWVCDGLVGFKCTSRDGVISYMYLNPSDVVDTGDTPNVFLYQGADGDPSKDVPICHIDSLCTG